jgi:hypothetical protein
MKLAAITFIIVALSAAPAFAKGSGTSHSGGSHSATHSSTSHSVSNHSVDKGSHDIKSYYRKDGTYVARAKATNPNKSKADNWSSKGNVNPKTGKHGTKDPITGK